MADVKAPGQSLSLLHVLVNVLKQQDEDLLNFTDDMPQVYEGGNAIQSAQADLVGMHFLCLLFAFTAYGSAEERIYAAIKKLLCRTRPRSCCYGCLQWIIR